MLMTAQPTPSTGFTTTRRHIVHDEQLDATSVGLHASTEGRVGSGAEMVDPSPSEAHIAGALGGNGSNVAHGMSSMFHQTSIEQSSPSLNKRFRDEDSMTRLFANAALQAQRERTLRRGPSIAQNFMLDGEDPEMAFHLLDLHWNRQHYTYLISYRPAIMDSLTNDGPYANKLLLNAIYFSSSLLSDRPQLRCGLVEPQVAGGCYFSRFKTLLVDELERPSIPTAVALLLCGATLVSCGRESTGWVYCGIAYRYVMSRLVWARILTWSKNDHRHGLPS